MPFKVLMAVCLTFFIIREGGVFDCEDGGASSFWGGSGEGGISTLSLFSSSMNQSSRRSSTMIFLNTPHCQACENETTYSLSLYIDFYLLVENSIFMITCYYLCLWRFEKICAWSSIYIRYILKNLPIWKKI